MATAIASPRSSAAAERLPPAALLNPATFLGALTVFVVGSLIVRAIWPGRR
jgi:hypothetical protein